SAGQLVIHRREMDLAQAARDVAARAQRGAAAGGSTLEVRADAPVIGQWDPSRIEHVIGNLLANALKYGAGLPIELTVEASGANAVLTVRDHGVGIAPADLGRLFDRFERGESGSTLGAPVEPGGLGMGLHIARHLVAAHRGSIDVASEPGAGAEF